MFRSSLALGHRAVEISVKDKNLRVGARKRWRGEEEGGGEGAEGREGGGREKEGVGGDGGEEEGEKD